MDVLEKIPEMNIWLHKKENGYIVQLPFEIYPNFKLNKPAVFAYSEKIAYQKTIEKQVGKIGAMIVLMLMATIPHIEAIKLEKFSFRIYLSKPPKNASERKLLEDELIGRCRKIILRQIEERRIKITWLS